MNTAETAHTKLFAICTQQFVPRQDADPELQLYLARMLFLTSKSVRDGQDP